MQEPTNCLSAFDHFVGLLLKGLNSTTPGVHAEKHFFKLIFSIVSYSSDSNKFDAGENFPEDTFSITIFSFLYFILFLLRITL